MKAKRALFDKEDTYSLRGLCMLAIIGHHLFQWTGSRYGVSYPMPVGLVFSNAGYLGSALFFLISGYGTNLDLTNFDLTRLRLVLLCQPTGRLQTVRFPERHGAFRGDCRRGHGHSLYSHAKHRATIRATSCQDGASRPALLPDHAASPCSNPGRLHSVLRQEDP